MYPFLSSYWIASKVGKSSVIWQQVLHRTYFGWIGGGVGLGEESNRANLLGGSCSISENDGIWS